MNDFYELFEKAKENLDEFEYEEFAHKTIKTLGYNSNTFSLLKLMDKTIKKDRFVNEITSNLKECAKMHNVELEDVNLEEDYDSFKKKMISIIPEEDFDGIMFDANVDMVDNYISYNRIQGLELLDNVNEYISLFDSGAELISNSYDYSAIKEEIFNDAGLSLEGLENLELDTSVFNDSYDFDDDMDLDLDIELEK